jgi:hypothetical protein
MDLRPTDAAANVFIGTYRGCVSVVMFFYEKTTQ